MSTFQGKFKQEFCLKHQNQRAEFIIYKKDEQIVQYYCRVCLEENPQLFDTVQPIQNVIKDREADLMIKFRLILDELQKQDYKLRNLQSDIQGMFLEWKKLLDEIYIFEDEVKMLFCDQNDEYYLEKFQQDILDKIEAEKQSHIQKIQQDLEEINIQLIKFKQKQVILKSLNKKNENEYFQFKGEQEQEKYPCGIEIFQNTMMASSEQDIKVWQIIHSENNNNTILIKEKETLNNHTGRILCSVHSKKIDWFATSGCDGKIFCSKLIDDKWVTTKSNRHHHQSIYTLILNNKEDQLFSGGLEGKVGVWDINLEENTIILSYELIESQSLIYSLCINPSDTCLILSNINQQLILWTKNKETQRYGLCEKKLISNIAYRSIFIKEDQFVIQYSQKDITSVFNIKNNQIIERKDLELKLNDTEVDGDFLFPTIYNSNKQLLIQKYGKFVYVIQQLPNEKLQIVQTIDCQDNFNYGNLSDDGNILIIWDYRTKKFKIYSIQLPTYNGLFQELEYYSVQQTQESIIQA